MTFEELGLRPYLLTRLAERGLTQPTPIQIKAIPEALKGRDVMGLAQTGTGKTYAFGLPISEALLASQNRCQPKTAQALILAPTRELAKQIHDSLLDVLSDAHLRLGLVVGGASINVQTRKLAKGMHILVATPGRLLDLTERGALSLGQTRFLVLDEADQMLDLGFIHALRKIAKMLPQERQTLLFSATMAKQMAEIAAAYLTDPVRVEVTPPGRTADLVTQSVIFAEPADKPDALIAQLDTHRDELALVFTRTKYGADKLARKIERAGFAVGAIHGNKSQGQRNRALEAFRAGELRVLVATDVAARGIDIPDVRHVYNFELPNVADNYVHRIGRTARAGRSGRALSLCAAAEAKDLRGIEKLIGQKIEVIGGTPPAFERPAKGPNKGRSGAGSKPGRNRHGAAPQDTGQPGSKTGKGAASAEQDHKARPNRQQRRRRPRRKSPAA